MARNDAFMFDEFVQDLYDGIHGDLSGASIKYILIDNSITPAADDATPRYADYSAYEVSAAGGYTTGGIALSGVATSYANGVLKFDDTGNIALALDAGGFEDAASVARCDATQREPPCGVTTSSRNLIG